ncbi:MAG: 30S ribosomal protein S6 [Clostridia bacterium]|nr:30S ribosomal protein S6 [Clostridia bacterium]
MNRYELTYIIDTAVEDTARKDLVERISNLITVNGGEVEKVDETWGKRRLAYAINYKTEGWYVLVTFKAPEELPRELQRNLRNIEHVIRYLVVKLEEKRSNVKPRAVRPQVVAEEEPKAEESAEVKPAEAADTDAV